LIVDLTGYFSTLTEIKDCLIQFYFFVLNTKNKIIAITAITTKIPTEKPALKISPIASQPVRPKIERIDMEENINFCIG
jgi:hypothetical protein